MKNLLQLLLFPFSLLGFAQSSVQDIDCAVLKDALYAVSNNTSHNFLAENNGSMLRFKDAVFYSNRQFFPQTKIQLNIPDGHLNITSYVDDLSATTPSDYLDAFQWQIYSCFEKNPEVVRYSALYDDKLYLEYEKASLSVYRSSAGYAIDIFPITPLPQDHKLPLPDMDVLVEMVKYTATENIRPALNKDEEEPVDLLPYPEEYYWYGTNKKVFKNINAGLIAREDGKDFIFVFADTESQYHPEIRTKGLKKIMDFIESGLSQRGIKVVSKYQDGENILLETPNTQLVLRYTHDVYDIHTANIILTLRKISRN